jgi:hypothetical protein
MCASWTLLYKIYFTANTFSYKSWDSCKNEYADGLHCVAEVSEDGGDIFLWNTVSTYKPKWHYQSKDQQQIQLRMYHYKKPWQNKQINSENRFWTKKTFLLVSSAFLHLWFLLSFCLPNLIYTNIQNKYFSRVKLPRKCGWLLHGTWNYVIYPPIPWPSSAWPHVHPPACHLLQSHFHHLQPTTKECLNNNAMEKAIK